MATISKSERREQRGRDLLRSSQLRYAAAYVLITSAVLIFLNIYAPIMIRRMAASSQRNAMLDKAQLIVSAFSTYEKLDEESVSLVIQSVNDLHTSRVLITDAGARCLYDAPDGADTLGRLILYPEVAEALEGKDAFYVRFEQTRVVSKAAMPIVAYNRIIGAVYLLELDPDQAELLSALSRNIFRVSLGLEVAVVLFSIVFALLFSRRMGRLFVSVRKLHGGDYSVRLPARGQDEIGRLGEAFNDLAERLHHSEEVRKQFVSNAAHELKTPLASIKLLTDSILLNDMDAATMREFVGDVGSEADRLTRLSEKLLELTRLDTQPAEDRAEVALLPVADRVLRMLSGVARSRRVRLSLDCAGDCTVFAAPDDVYQILFNLVENAIKYNREDGSVRICAAPEAGFVAVTVEDSGIGIPEADKAHIFERFYRVDKARSRKAGGAGLGLSIVQDMVLRNGGVISVEDRPGGGTVFRLLLPQQPGKEAEA